jgi:transketolase
MRNVFADEITRLAVEDEGIVLLSGDIGNRLFNDYKAVAANRFFNCGVAEANMIGMSTGMALCGLRPVAYTIAPFITTRCLEQIRVDVCYHNVPVIIVGVGAGFSYAGLGATHHSGEDIAFLRAIPNMHVVCPGDPVEVRLALRAAIDLKKPVYLRLGKKGEPIVHDTSPDFQIGRVITISEGDDVCLISTGNILPVVVKAAEELDRIGLSAQIVSCHTVKPLDLEFLGFAFSRFQLVVTIEEHSRIGGLGGSVAEWFTDQPILNAKLHRIGTSDLFLHEVGDQAYVRQRFGLTASAISKQVVRKLGQF